MGVLIPIHSPYAWGTNELYAFFKARLEEMGKIAWSQKDICMYDEWHHPHVLFAKLSDSTRFFRVVYNEAHEIVAYFESKQSGIDERVQVVQWIMVREDYRRQGIAKRLYRAFEDWCRENGYTVTKSCTMVQNGVSQRMHQTLGFHQTEEKDGTVWFEKEMSAAPPFSTEATKR